MLLKWFTKRLQSLSRRLPTTHRQTTFKHLAFQPGVEQLEQRALLSASAVGPALLNAGPTKFGTEAAFKEYLIDRGIQQYSELLGHTFASGAGNAWGLPYGLAASTTVTQFNASGSTSLPTSGAPGYSQTNLHEPGVDEGDTVKTDGRYLYVLANNHLVIVDSLAPTKLASLSTVALQGSAIGEYLHGNHLTVITQDDYNWSHPGVTVTVFDVGNHRAPVIVQTTTLDGYYNSSRAIDNKIYVAMTSSLPTSPLPEFTSSWGKTVYETAAAYRARLEAASLGRFLPEYVSRWTDTQGEHTQAGFLTSLGDIYRPAELDIGSLVSLVALDASGAQAGPIRSLGMLTSYSTTVYAAPGNFYFIAPHWHSDTTSTSIDKVSLANGDLQWTATGQVPGTILNQFSVGENGAYLGIATTTGWGTNASNNVFVLGQDDAALNIVGSVVDIAHGESIFAVRFMGDRAFVSTFERIDPLFAIDLSSPTAPVVAGQLEVSGVTDYLQAVDATHLIGVGRGSSGVEISLFDVSDLNNPTLVNRYDVAPQGWSWSNASYDYHAITYFPELQTLALPVTSSSPGSQWGYEYAEVVFHVDGPTGALQLQGQVSDSTAITRGVFIDNLLYSISASSIQVHALADLDTTIGQTALPAYDYSPILNPSLLSTGTAQPSIVINGTNALLNSPPSSSFESSDGNAPATFGSEAALKDYLLDRAHQQYAWLFGSENQYGGYYPFLQSFSSLVTSAVTASSISFTPTNTQEQGVDEGDSVKTDGHYLYLLSNNHLVILDAAPTAGLKSMSNITLTGSALAEYLNGDRLTVISQDYQHSTVLVTVFDVSDRSAPTIERQTTLDGYYKNSRAINDTVYVALNNNLSNLPSVQYTSSWEKTIYETEAAYRARLEALPVEGALPHYTTHWSDATGEHETTGLLTAPGNVYRPTTTDDSSLVSLVALNTGGAKLAPVQSVSLLTSYDATLYAAPDNFYLLSTHWSYGPAWGYQTTSIEKFTLADGGIQFTATGQVPGRILNQFSVSENGDYLEIATTTGWGTNANNHLYVLGENGQALNIVGQLENLAPGESIYAVRFMGDRAYISTFLRVDPLFAVDLSDPTAPRLAGQLEVSGYTGYLQAIDATHLIGIGRDQDWSLGRNELEVSLFDVKDLDHPTLVSRYDITPNGNGWSNSQAEYDYHAITYYPELQALALPVDNQGVDSGGQWFYQNNLMIFHVDGTAGTLDLLGQIGDSSPISRSVFIGNVVYSISQNSVQAHAIDALDTVVAQATLPQAPENHRPWHFVPLPIVIQPIFIPIPPVREPGVVDPTPLPTDTSTTPAADPTLATAEPDVAAVTVAPAVATSLSPAVLIGPFSVSIHASASETDVALAVATESSSNSEIIQPHGSSQDTQDGNDATLLANQAPSQALEPLEERGNGTIPSRIEEQAGSQLAATHLPPARGLTSKDFAATSQTATNSPADFFGSSFSDPQQTDLDDVVASLSDRALFILYALAPAAAIPVRDAAVRELEKSAPKRAGLHKGK